MFSSDFSKVNRHPTVVITGDKDLSPLHADFDAGSEFLVDTG
jgi:hypothetical protein